LDGIGKKKEKKRKKKKKKLNLSPFSHGLPIEFAIDQQLGIKTREQVLEYGIGNYNEACRAIVMK
jgi:isoleucyl-tRNA synthetase